MGINRKGELGDQMIMIAFVFLMAIVLAGIAAGVLIFAGSETDFRQTEADMLNSRIRSCLAEKQFDLNSLKMEDVYTKCNLNAEVLGSTNLIKICVSDSYINSENCIDEKNPAASTGGDFVVCALTGKNNKFPKCSLQLIQLKGKYVFVITESKQKIRRVQ